MKQLETPKVLFQKLESNTNMHELHIYVSHQYPHKAGGIHIGILASRTRRSAYVLRILQYVAHQLHHDTKYRAKVVFIKQPFCCGTCWIPKTYQDTRVSYD